MKNTNTAKKKAQAAQAVQVETEEIKDIRKRVKGFYDYLKENGTTLVGYWCAQVIFEESDPVLKYLNTYGLRAFLLRQIIDNR